MSDPNPASDTNPASGTNPASDPNPASGLELRGVSQSVPDGTARRTILDGIDLRVAAGEVVVVTGGSGAGKSTLLAIAGLLRRPEAGEVVLGGVAASGLSDRRRTALRKEKLAIVYQSANLFPPLGAQEQLELVGHIQGEPRAEVRDRARALLDELGLGGQAGNLPNELSGGERQRVGIARALMARPAVLLADEPTASLDPALAAGVADLLAAQTRERGLATVLVTHDEEPQRVADRCFHLAHGALTEVAAVSG